MDIKPPRGSCHPGDQDLGGKAGDDDERSVDSMEMDVGVQRRSDDRRKNVGDAKASLGLGGVVMGS